MDGGRVRDFEKELARQPRSCGHAQSPATSSCTAHVTRGPARPATRTHPTPTQVATLLSGTSTRAKLGPSILRASGAGQSTRSDGRPDTRSGGGQGISGRAAAALGNDVARTMQHGALPACAAPLRLPSRPAPRRSLSLLQVGGGDFHDLILPRYQEPGPARTEKEREGAQRLAEGLWGMPRAVDPSRGAQHSALWSARVQPPGRHPLAARGISWHPFAHAGETSANPRNSRKQVSHPSLVNSRKQGRNPSLVNSCKRTTRASRARASARLTQTR